MIKKISLWAIPLIIGFVIGIFLTNVKFTQIHITDSASLLNIITLFGGLVVLFIYLKQKIDAKKDAANILYLEIANAEKILKQAKEGLEKGNLPENVLIISAMPTESWTKYKYLFVRDFDEKDWNALEDFYNKCYQFDQAVKHNSSLFQKNEDQIRSNLDQALAEFVKKAKIDSLKIDTDDLEQKKWQDFVRLTTNFYNLFLRRQDLFFYKPQKPVTDAIFCLNNMNLNILQSNAIRKLKILASLKG